jgi:hypothetical protein
MSAPPPVAVIVPPANATDELPPAPALAATPPPPARICAIAYVTPAGGVNVPLAVNASTFGHASKVSPTTTVVDTEPCLCLSR